MTSNQLIKNYDNFDYNSEFIPNYNIFNVNSGRYIGIGTIIPKHHLSVTNNINIKGNLIITGNLLYNTNTQYDSNYIHILYKNKSDLIKIGKLIYSSPDSKYSDYNFYKNNDCLYVNTNDNRPNTILTYKSQIFTNNNRQDTLSIDLLVSNKIYITHIYIYDDSKNIITDLNSLTINNISTTFSNGVYLLSQNIELTPHTKNTLTIVSNNTSKSIQLFGNYDFSAGSLWENNNTNNNTNNNRINNIHTTKNVSILSNHSYGNKLYVNGDGIINQNYNSNIIKTNIFKNSANLDLDGMLTTKNIISNKLIIDTPQISFGNNISNHLATIGNDTFITSSGDLYVKDLTVNSNMNTNGFLNKNNDKITLSNNININDFININNINTQFYYNTVISNKSDYTHNLETNSLLVDGNTLITGNVSYQNISYQNFDLDSTYINSNINSIYVSGLAHTGAFTKTNNIITNTFVSPNINLLPSVQQTNTPGTLYYDNSTNTFKAHTSNNVIEFNLETDTQIDYSNFTLSQNTKVLEIKNLKTDFLDTTSLNTTHLDNDTTYTKTIKLPLYDQPTSDYNYSDLIGNMKFNNDTNKKFEIHDGEKWNTLQFESDFNTPLNGTQNKYSIIPNINLIKNIEQFIPTIPQNFKYNISQTGIGSYYNLDTTDNNRTIINHINKEIIYNLNRDDDFGIAINNNVIGIGTNFYIASNTNLFTTESDNIIYQTTLINENDYENMNLLFVHINKNTDINNNANENNTGNNSHSEDLKTYLEKQNNKVYSIFNNKIYVESGGNNIDTYIRLKNKQFIGSDKYNAYLYYEPLLESLEFYYDYNNTNLIRKLDINTYKHNLIINNNQIFIICKVNINDNIEVSYNNLPININISTQKFINSDSTINLVVKNLTKNTYNIYTIEIKLMQ